MARRLPPDRAAELAKRRGTAELRRIARDMQAPLSADKLPGCRACKTVFACTASGRCKHPPPDRNAAPAQGSLKL